MGFPKEPGLFLMLPCSKGRSEGHVEVHHMKVFAEPFHTSTLQKLVCLSNTHDGGGGGGISIMQWYFSEMLIYLGNLPV